jgi:hypothetical protein
MFRITGDVWDKRPSIERGFKRWEMIQDISVEGVWPDLDMIPFGRLVVWNPAVNGRDQNVLLAGHGNERNDRFSQPQRRTFMAQRALAASPLFMGGELTMSSDEVIGMVTNAQMLACNQNGVMGKLAYRTEQIDVWRTAHRSVKVAGWFGLFNRTESPLKGELNLEKIGVDRNAEMWDIWRDCPVKSDSGVLKYELEADDVLFVSYGRVGAQ